MENHWIYCSPLTGVFYQLLGPHLTGYKVAHHAKGVQHVHPFLNCCVVVPLLNYCRGSSTISSDKKVVVVSNLYDGLDWYMISNCAFSRLVPIHITKNVIIPVQFVDRDSLLITGGTSGIAKVLDACTVETIQALDHDCWSYPTLLSLTF